MIEPSDPLRCGGEILRRDVRAGVESATCCRKSTPRTLVRPLGSEKSQGRTRFPPPSSTPGPSCAPPRSRNRGPVSGIHTRATCSITVSIATTPSGSAGNCARSTSRPASGNSACAAPHGSLRTGRRTCRRPTPSGGRSRASTRAGTVSSAAVPTSRFPRTWRGPTSRVGAA
jgi:hypothetical protein